VTPRTYHCEGGREEAEGIDDWCNDAVGQTLDMLPDILARRDQQGGHQEHHEGPSIVQLEHYVIDDHPRDIELEDLRVKIFASFAEAKGFHRMTTQRTQRAEVFLLRKTKFPTTKVVHLWT